MKTYGTAKAASMFELKSEKKGKKKRQANKQTRKGKGGIDV